MYYFSANIVKPLTEPYQLSLAELVGPAEMEWFVSHFWGMPVKHLSDAIRRHAQSSPDWRGSSYWICTFSNNQWRVEDELGNGRWEEPVASDCMLYNALHEFIYLHPFKVHQDNSHGRVKSFCSMRQSGEVGYVRTIVHHRIITFFDVFRHFLLY